MALPQPLGPGVIDAGGRIGRDFAPERQQESLSLFGALADDIAARRRSGDVVIASYSKGAHERLAGLLADAGVEGAVGIRTASDIPGKGGGLYWPRNLGAGARLPGGGPDGDRRAGRAGRPADPRAAAEEARGEFPHRGGGTRPGDLVVHIDHGIGRYLGLKRAGERIAPRSVSTLEFAERHPRLRAGGVHRLRADVWPAEQRVLQARQMGGGAWEKQKKARLEARCATWRPTDPPAGRRRELRRARSVPPDHHAWEELLRGGSPTTKPPISSRPCTRLRRTCKSAASPWIGWSAATSATERPKSRCAQPSRLWNMTARWQCWSHDAPGPSTL